MTKFCCLIVIILCTIDVSKSERLTTKCLALNGRCGRKDFTCDVTFGSGWASEGRCCHEMPCCKYLPVVTSSSCGFESEDSCIFKDSLKDDFDWTRTNNTSPANNTGNYYIYIDTSTQNPGDKAVLTTEASNLQASRWCLSFRYLMKGSGKGKLEVFAGNKTSSLSSLLDVSGGQFDPDLWTTVFINIPKFDNPVIAIEGVKGGDFRGVIAIDDFSLDVGSCGF